VTHKWINELRDKEEFAELLKERWKVLDQVLEELLKEGGVFDTWVIENEGSYASDSAKWQDFYKESDPEAGNDYVEYCNALKDWINAHRKWINENIDDIGRILVRVTIRSDVQEEKTVKVEVSSFLFAELEPEEAEGYVFEGWYDEEGNDLSENATADNDMIIFARYRKEQG